MLSPKSQQLIHDYLNLPFSGISGVRCPYFNNARLHQRGQLRVLIGKGTPKEIVEEAKVISTQYHAGIFDKTGNCCIHNEHTGTPVTNENIRKFLIDNNLGVDCSGFVSQVLRVHFKETKKIDFVKKLYIISPKNILRWLISKLRPIESISVNTYANNVNTTVITDITQIEPGDLIAMLETGPQNKRNHILLITNNDGRTINYVHSRAWSSEGNCGHGVAEGKIIISNPDKNILEQEWIEKDCAGDKNETYVEAKNARLLEIRRLKI